MRYLKIIKNLLTIYKKSNNNSTSNSISYNAYCEQSSCDSGSDNSCSSSVDDKKGAGEMSFFDCSNQVNVDDLILAESMQTEQQHFLQSIIDGIANPIIVIDKKAGLKFINKTGKEYVRRHGKEDFKQLYCCYFFGLPCKKSENRCPVDKVLCQGKSVTESYEYMNVDGSRKYVQITASPLWNKKEPVEEIIIVYYDITDLKQAENKLRESEMKLQHLAQHDTVTGLPNRLLFYDRLQQAMAFGLRNRKAVALLFLNLDRFKTINEVLGHDMGDTLLRVVAERLRGCVRRSDTVARFGGDEFAIILEQIKNPKDVAMIAQNILKRMSESFTVNRHECFIGTSIGISMYPISSDNIEKLIKNADIAMCRAKEEGGGSYRFYTSEMDAEVFRELSFENSLRKALNRNEFTVYYQPQVDLLTGRIIGVEALLRWHHPDLGILTPSRFIHLAEDMGLMVPIGEWVLETACSQMKTWLNSGFASFHMAVNISNRQFRQPNLFEMVLKALKRTGLEPSFLELELTENIIMLDAEDMIKRLHKLKKMGIKLSIDDFGTGYSCLSNLKRLEINTLKIDRSFIQDIHIKPDNAAIVRAVLSLAKSLKLDVIAEGVETEGELDFLRSQNCNNIQGYYFSKPIPYHSLTTLIKRGWPQKFLK